MYVHVLRDVALTFALPDVEVGDAYMLPKTIFLHFRSLAVCVVSLFWSAAACPALLGCGLGDKRLPHTDSHRRPVASTPPLRQFIIASDDEPTPRLSTGAQPPIFRHCKGTTDGGNILVCVRAQHGNKPPPGGCSSAPHAQHMHMRCSHFNPGFRVSLQVPTFNLYATVFGARPPSISNRAREAALRRPWNGRQPKVVAGFTPYRRENPKGQCSLQERLGADGTVVENVRTSSLSGNPHPFPITLRLAFLITLLPHNTLSPPFCSPARSSSGGLRTSPTRGC